MNENSCVVRVNKSIANVLKNQHIKKIGFRSEFKEKQHLTKYQGSDNNTS